MLRLAQRYRKSAPVACVVRQCKKMGMLCAILSSSCVCAAHISEDSRMAPKKKSKAESEKLPAVAWRWLDGDSKTGQWKEFNPADAAILETEFGAKKQKVVTSAMSFSIGSSTEYDFVNWTQKNLSTGVTRNVQRLTSGVWEYLDDHHMYVAFYDDDNDLVERMWRSMPPDGGQFVTTALSWNKGYDSKYTFTFVRDDSGNYVATQKNEDSGNVRKLRRTLPEAKDTAAWGMASAAAATLVSETTTVEVTVDAAAVDVPAPSSDTSAAPPVTPSMPAATTAVSASVFQPPATWAQQTAPYQLFDVAEGTKEYKDVLEPFLKTLKNKATIHSVRRIQNQPLWRFYALTRHRVALRNGGDPNEMNLFHGARARENMDAIMQFGFDMRVARDGSAGVGIYFAVNASYSNAGYVLQNPDKSKEMFVCRVTVGSCVQGKHGMKRPPPKGKKPDSDLHDSVHNGVNIMYIVFDNFQAYPEYLIKYTNVNGW